MSSCQQSVIVGLLHDEPHAIHCLELLDFCLFATDGCSEVPFPQILKHRETKRWLSGERWLEAEDVLALKPTICKWRALMERTEVVESVSAAASHVHICKHFPICINC